jgi:hypothetical protein
MDGIIAGAGMICTSNLAGVSFDMIGFANETSNPAPTSINGKNLFRVMELNDALIRVSLVLVKGMKL